MSSTHEDFRRDHHRRPSDRGFGWVFGGALVFFGLWPLRHHAAMRLWLLAPGLLVLAVTLTRPSVLHPLNLGWTKLGILLGKVVNPIVTGLLFYLVFTPAAIVLRWMGKDLLNVTRDPAASTYWIQRDGAGPGPAMIDQF